MTNRYIFPSILFLSFLIIYGFRLSDPPEVYYDEVYHVKTAREFLTLSGNTDNTHPPLGKVLIAGSIKVFGDEPWAWRLFPYLAGVGSLLVFYYLAKRFFQNQTLAFLASLLLGMDGFSITQSRIAMLNTMMFLWMLLAVLFLIKFFEDTRVSKNLIFSGFFIGLTAATRWVGFGVLAVMGLIFWSHFSKISFKNQAGLFLLSFFLVPILVYFGAHLILPFIKGHSWIDIFSYQKNMLHYHHTLTAGHNYGSEWWSWPVMTRPIWYYFQKKQELIHGILCVGNPVIMWMFFPALGYLIWHYLKTKDRQDLFLIVGYLSQWLPWAFISRVKFFHYYYPVMPFVVLIILVYLRGLYQTGRWGRIFVLVYLAAAAGMFVYWYPLYAGYPISEWYYQNHLWFKSWI